MPKTVASTMASSAWAAECTLRLPPASTVHAIQPASQIHAVLRINIGRCRSYAGCGGGVDYTFGYAKSEWIGSRHAGAGQYEPFGTGIYGQFSGGAQLQAA